MADPIQRFRKEFPDVWDALHEQNWKVDKAPNGHMRFTAPDGRRVFAASTPRRVENWLVTVARLKQHGLDMAEVERVRGT